MVIGQDLLGELGIIINFNDRLVSWDIGTIEIKDRDKAFYHQQRSIRARA
jgi:hypothetical protein